MILKEEFMEIKILYRQGHSVRQIARQMNLSRNTVRRYLRECEQPEIKKRLRISKLNEFKNYLNERQRQARPHVIPATVLMREIVEQGYQGQLSILRVYLRTLRPQVMTEPIVRFETREGKQMQVDWIEFRSSPDRLSAFVATLGFSRSTYIEFVSDEKLETLMRCHQNAFEHFGGVPYEILYDNVKTVILERDAYKAGRHRFNPKFMQLAKHYNFMPRVCRPYRAKTKGKVERFNRYLRYSFYYPLTSKLKPNGILVDVPLANYEVKLWMRDISEVRIHGTTKRRPKDLLIKEKPYLQSLPQPYLEIKIAKPIDRSYIRRTVPGLLQHPLSVYQAFAEGAQR